MAGFIHKYDSRNSSDSRSPLARLRSLGINVNSRVFAKSRTVGYDDAPGLNAFSSATSDYLNDLTGGMMNGGQLKYGGASVYGTGSQNSIYNMPYSEMKRNLLRQMSVQDEIEEVLDIMCDETIWFGKNSRFCELQLSSDSVKPEIKERAVKIFEDTYNMLGFSEGNRAWDLFRKFLVDGFLAFEIVYDNVNDPKKIIGIKEIDPLTLEKKINPENGVVQYQQTTTATSGLSFNSVTLDESQIIFISYSRTGADGTQRCSYVERLIRSFNLLRIAESTRIVWSVSNATFRTMFTVPVEKSSARGKQTLGSLMQEYHEDVSFNWDSGEMRTNGNAMLPFNKEYWFPSVDGQRIEMQTVGQDGPPLNDTDLINYLRNKFRQTSKIPIIRFDKEQGMGVYTLNAEGLRREEIKFSNFKSRLRQVWQELLLKPVRTQLVIEFPALAEDSYFKNSLTLHFFEDTSFEENAAVELLNNRSQAISSMLSSIATRDAEGNDLPYFDLDFLVSKYSGLSQADIEENKAYKERKALKAEGYKDEDIEKILAGADKKDFKKGKPEKQETAEGGEGGGGPEQGGSEPGGGGSEPGGSGGGEGGGESSLF